MILPLCFRPGWTKFAFSQSMYHIVVSFYAKVPLHVGHCFSLIYNHSEYKYIPVRPVV